MLKQSRGPWRRALSRPKAAQTAAAGHCQSHMVLPGTCLGVTLRGSWGSKPPGERGSVRVDGSLAGSNIGQAVISVLWELRSGFDYQVATAGIDDNVPIRNEFLKLGT